MISAWRIVKAKYAAGAFTGLGARASGGRWNSPGVSMVYTAGTMALAQLEMLVHLESDELLGEYVAFEIDFDETLSRSLDLGSLPRNWRGAVAPRSLRVIGDAWAAKLESPVLRVPSAIVPEEFNFLLNPAHPMFSHIHIGHKRQLRFDPRLR